MDVLSGWCRDLEVELKEFVGSKSKGVLHNMQEAVISGAVATKTINIDLHLLASTIRYFRCINHQENY